MEFDDAPISPAPVDLKRFPSFPNVSSSPSSLPDDCHQIQELLQTIANALEIPLEE
ncbi:hypothetical protein KIL84_015727, partial [Mauremys mutica]